MNRTQPLRSVAVFGGGIVALSAAAAFARALPRADLTLVTTPVDPAAFADRLPTIWPSGAAALPRTGLDEETLVSGGLANHRLANHFANWSTSSVPWLAPEGEPITVAGNGRLHQRWLYATKEADLAPYHALFPAAALAVVERFALPLPSSLDRADHTLRLDPSRLGQALGSQLRQARVASSMGTIGDVVRRSDGQIAAVQLTDGRLVESDLFIDATGPAALLQGGAPRIDWRDSIPADRLLTTPAANLEPSLLDFYEASDLGWSARWSMPAGGVRAFAFAGQLTTEARARSALGSGRDAATLASYSPGRLHTAWTANCLAIGEASAQLGPLGLAGLTLALAQLELALDLLPGRDMEPLLLAEYNRRIALRADRLRDYLATHYLSSRTAGAFWRAVQDCTLRGEDFSATVARFARRGALGRHEEESVNAESWHAVLIGQGFRPAQVDPIATSSDPAVAAERLRKAQQQLAAATQMMPLYRDWLAQVRR